MPTEFKIPELGENVTAGDVLAQFRDLEFRHSTFPLQAYA